MKVFDEIKYYVQKHFKEGDNVRVHITQLDTKKNYNTLCGVYINDELTETFELTEVNNNMIEDFKKEMDDWIKKNTLYLI
jgi:hypothetical protein